MKKPQFEVYFEVHGRLAISGVKRRTAAIGHFLESLVHRLDCLGLFEARILTYCAGFLRSRESQAERSES